LDYPFDPFIVSNVGTVDRAKDEVSAYFIVSADLKAALILPTSTKSQWFKEWVDASNTGRQEEFYMAYKSSAKFISLEV
jgi:hypothetical protein